RRRWSIPPGSAAPRPESSAALRQRRLSRPPSSLSSSPRPGPGGRCRAPAPAARRLCSLPRGGAPPGPAGSTGNRSCHARVPRRGDGLRGLEEATAIPIPLEGLLRIAGGPGAKAVELTDGLGSPRSVHQRTQLLEGLRLLFEVILERVAGTRIRLVEFRGGRLAVPAPKVRQGSREPGPTVEEGAGRDHPDEEEVDRYETDPSNQPPLPDFFSVHRMTSLRLPRPTPRSRRWYKWIMAQSWLRSKIGRMTRLTSRGRGPEKTSRRSRKRLRRTSR